MVKKVVTKKRVMDVERRAFTGGLCLSFIFVVLILGGKIFGIFSSLLNILIDTYGELGLDVSYFGVVIGAVYGFITGFLLSGIHAKIYNKLPDKFK